MGTAMKIKKATQIPAEDVRVGDILDLSDERVRLVRVVSVVVGVDGWTTVNGDCELPLYVWREG